MDLPTYTNIWRIEKRLYKLYDLRLPMPLPIVWIGVFVGVFVPWSLLLVLVGVPLEMPWHVLFLVPPGIVTWLSTRPVIEGKRLTELLESHLRYLGEPKAWYRLAPTTEPEAITFSARVWRTTPARAKFMRPGKARDPQRRREGQRITGPRQVRPAVAAAAAAAGQATVAEPATTRTGWGSRRGAAPALKAQARQGVLSPATGPPAGPARREEGASGGSGRRQDVPLVVVHGDDDASGQGSTPVPVEREPASRRGPGRRDGGRSDGGRREHDRADAGRRESGQRDGGLTDAGRRGGGKKIGGRRLSARESAIKEAAAQQAALRETALREAAIREAALGDAAGREVIGREAVGQEAGDRESVGGEAAGRASVVGRDAGANAGARKSADEEIAAHGAEGHEIAAEERAVRETGAAPGSAARGDAERRGGPGSPGEAEAEAARGTVVPIKTAQSRKPAAGKPIDTEALRRLRRLAASADVPADPAERMDAPGRLESERHEEEVARDQHRKGQPPRLGPGLTLSGAKRVWPPLNPDAKPSSRPGAPRPERRPTAGPAAHGTTPVSADTGTPALPPVAEESSRPEPVRDVPEKQSAAGDARTEPGPAGETPSERAVTGGEAPSEPAAAVGRSEGDIPEGDTHEGGAPQRPGDGDDVPDGGTASAAGAAGERLTLVRGVAGDLAASPADADDRAAATQDPVPETSGEADGPTSDASGRAEGRASEAAPAVSEDDQRPAAVNQRPAAAGRQDTAADRPVVRTGELVVPVPVPRPGEGRVRRVESVIGRDSGGWRRIAQVVVGGSGVRTDGSEIDEARARGVFSGGRRVVVLGCTGGAGQSTTALMLGHTFAHYRDDRVVAIDANTGGATLTSKIQPETPETLTSLLSGLDRVSGYLTMRGYTTRTASGLEVISADTDAGAEQRLADRSFFSDHRLGESMRLLDRHYKLAVIDPAAALAARLLPYADQLVLVVPASEEAPEAVAMTYEWLDGHGCAELRRRAVMVVNGVSRRSMTDVEQAESVARGRCRAIVRVPWEDDLAPGGAEVVDPGQLRAAGRRAYLALAGVVVAGFAAQTVRPSEEELASDPPGTRIGER